jgi:hypothetical protein
MRKNGALHYLHADHLGSTRLVTKADGTLDARQVSYAYGRFRGGFPTLPTDHQFTGQQVDFIK